MDTIIRINIRRLLFTTFVFFFLFSNLISRISGHNINLLFYGSWLLVFIYSIIYIKPNILTVFWAIVPLFFSVYIADPRYILSANLLTIKDFIIPILCTYIGYALSKTTNTEVIFQDINLLYFFALSYGILQEMSFYTGNLAQVLPWDANYLSTFLDMPSNVLQPGGLLRFFGTMNSFVEFQIVIVFLGAFLWLNREKMKNNKLLYLNIIMMFAFISLALERSPIMMGIILLLFWKLKAIITNYKILFYYILAIGVICLLIIINLDFINSNPLIFGAYHRLYNAITLNLKNDAAVDERIHVQWKQSLELARDNYFGIGPGRLSPSAEKIYPMGYVGPHNNFLAIYLAYGLLGLLLFVILLLLGVWHLSHIEDNYRFFGYGMIVAFASMAMFNMPFIGKQGIIFFYIFGYLCSQKFKRK